MLNWIDIAIIGIIAISGLLSLFRGFTREALSLVTWALAFAVAFVYSPQIAPKFAQWVSVPELRITIAFALLFIIVLILGSIVAAMIGNLVDTTGLGGTDALLGVVFGVLRGALVVSALVILAEFTKYPETADWKNAKLLPQFEKGAQWLRQKVPQLLSEFEKQKGQRPK